MRRARLAALLLTVAGPSMAPVIGQQCGYPPYPPADMEQCRQVCICDPDGRNCAWRYECDR